MKTFLNSSQAIDHTEVIKKAAIVSMSDRMRRLRKTVLNARRSPEQIRQSNAQSNTRRSSEQIRQSNAQRMPGIRKIENARSYKRNRIEILRRMKNYYHQNRGAILYKSARFYELNRDRINARRISKKKHDLLADNAEHPSACFKMKARVLPLEDLPRHQRSSKEKYCVFKDPERNVEEAVLQMHFSSGRHRQRAAKELMELQRTPWTGYLYGHPIQDQSLGLISAVTWNEADQWRDDLAGLS